jgi:hypothetical protein
VHAGAAADSALRGDGASGGRDPDLHLTSDLRGLVHVPVHAPGWWNVRAAQVLPAAPEDAGRWEVRWATYVFHVGEGRVPRR